MNLLQLSTIFEKYDHEYLQFHKIENPLHSRPDICAFLYLDKLCPGTTDIIYDVKDDTIYLNINIDQFLKTVTEDDIIYISRCGVHFDNKNLCLKMFV